MLRLNQRYSLAHIIAALKNPELHHGEFCIYGGDTDVQLDKEYLVADYPYIDDEDNEVYPAAAAEQQFILDNEQLGTVINHLQQQRPDATLLQYLSAIRYYLAHGELMTADQHG